MPSTSVLSITPSSSATFSAAPRPSASLSPSASETPSGRTTVIIVQPSQSATSIDSSPKANSFLNNKGAEGIVFTLVSIVVIVAIFLIATFTIRRRRRREIEEILSFDPAAVDARRCSIEKISIRTSEGSEVHHRTRNSPCPSAAKRGS